MPATFDTFKMAHNMSMAAMPDRKVEILDTLAEGDKVVVRCLMTGTNTGGFPAFGAGPNGGKIEVEWISIYRLEGNKIAEHWAVLDYMAILTQIGAWAPPPMPGT
jgi:predicted ester cyclase